MARSKILTIVMAGGAGSRMAPLTDVRAKPAMPLAGTYRLIDIPLSNCVHSGLTDVWVVEQFQPQGLNDHLSNGRPWDLDRTYGGLRIMPPHQGTAEGGWHQGNADALARNRRFIREFAPELILVLSADHLYTLDYGSAVEAHRSQPADVTIVTTRRPIEHASRHAVVVADAGGKVTGFAYKPDEPPSDVVATEVFVYSAEPLLALLDELSARKEAEQGEQALSDFGDELLPAMVEQGRAFAFPLPGYWRDLGTVSSYWSCHMDLLAAEPPITLDHPDWPIFTYGTQRLPARILASARIGQSLIAPGCRVHGQVERSVLGPGVVVEEGATVRDSVLFGDTVVKAGAVVERAIVDSFVQIGERARVGAPGDLTEEGEELDKQLAVVGQRARVANGARVAPGERLAPPSPQNAR